MSEATGDLQQLLSAATALPRRQWLEQELKDARNAVARGYYLPDEEERLVDVYARYLAVRSSLIELLRKAEKRSGEDLKAFTIAFASASILLRAGTYLCETATENRTIWKKLDEEVKRYGIPRKSFTKVYRGVSRPLRLWRYHIAWKFYRENRDVLRERAAEEGWSEAVELLAQEEEFMQVQARTYLQRSISYRLFSFGRRNYSGYRQVMFSLFRMGGSLVAELRQPALKLRRPGKQVTSAVRKQLVEMLRAGDVVITRHNDALSNLFLPGFWPHAALYAGEGFIEAKKDGVLFRSVDETLAVDSVLVLRPSCSEEDIQEALMKAHSHVGKGYDFVFDFRQAERLACTAVVYRSYQGMSGQSFELSEQSGRLVLTAEDLIRQLVGKFGFRPQVMFGVGGARFVSDDERQELLRPLLKTESKASPAGDN